MEPLILGPRTLVLFMTVIVVSTLFYALHSFHSVRQNHGVSASDLAMSGQAKYSDLAGADLEFPTGPTGRFVLVDTEYTTWEGAHARHWSGPGEAREVVQIAAIKVRLKYRPVRETLFNGMLLQTLRMQTAYCVRHANHHVKLKNLKTLTCVLAWKVANEELTGGYREVAAWSSLIPSPSWKRSLKVGCNYSSDVLTSTLSPGFIVQTSHPFTTVCLHANSLVMEGREREREPLCVLLWQTQLSHEPNEVASPNVASANNWGENQIFCWQLAILRWSTSDMALREKRQGGHRGDGACPAGEARREPDIHWRNEQHPASLRSLWTHALEMDIGQHTPGGGGRHGRPRAQRAVRCALHASDARRLASADKRQMYIDTS
eukprot:9479398-Pyramimonas_sp.AAC.2